MHVAIDRADWKSAHAEGALTVAPPYIAPEGRLTFAMTRFADLAPLLGKPVTGSVEATLDCHRGRGKARGECAECRHCQEPRRCHASTLNATVTDPASHPVVDGNLSLEGLSAGRIGASGTVQAQGPIDALAIKLAATLPALSGAPAKTERRRRRWTCRGEVPRWRRCRRSGSNQSLRLLAPARIDAADGVAVDNMRLGLQQAVLTISGKAGSNLDLTASLRDLPADIAAIVSPELAANGTISADARLTGTSARPDGTVQLNARGVQLTQWPGSGNPGRQPHRRGGAERWRRSDRRAADGRQLQSHADRHRTRFCRRCARPADHGRWSILA